MPQHWADAMERGLASMAVDDARVVVAAGFVETVAELTGNSSYTAERGGGAVAAKTVTGPGGSVVVVNYEELRSRPSEDIRRLLAHEAGHIVIASRGVEELSGNRDDDDTEWQWLLKCLTGLAMVELRIERSLAELGYPPAEWSDAAAVDRNMQITNVEVINAVLDRSNAADPRRLQNALLSTLNHVTKLLAYIAGPLVAGGEGFSPAQLSAQGRVNWADYIAPTWDRRLALWGRVPSASEVIPVDSWRDILRESTALEQEFLLDFGFAFEDTPSGGYGFYRKSGDDVFTRRLRRVSA